MEIDQVILHTDPETGRVVITYPTGELSLEETAKKDVPTEVNYWIVNLKDLPEDRSFRDAWELDLDFLREPDGVGKGEL